MTDQSRRWFTFGVGLSLLVTAAPAFGHAHHQHRHHHYHHAHRAKLSRLAREVHVPQQQGYITTRERLQRDKNAPPEGDAAKAGQGQSAPITCNAQNASSPSCYTATQQGRGR